MSTDAPNPQGPDQQTLDVRCIRPKALFRVAHPSPLRNWPSLKRRLWHLKGASVTCTRTQRLLLHVSGCPGPPGTRPSPFGRSLHPSPSVCTCRAPITPQKLAFAETVALALEGHVSHLHPNAEAAAACPRMPWTPSEPTSSLRTFAASVPRRLHVWRTPNPPETRLH